MEETGKIGTEEIDESSNRIVVVVVAVVGVAVGIIEVEVGMFGAEVFDRIAFAN